MEPLHRQSTQMCSRCGHAVGARKDCPVCVAGVAPEDYRELDPAPVDRAKLDAYVSLWRQRWAVAERRAQHAEGRANRLRVAMDRAARWARDGVHGDKIASDLEAARRAEEGRGR